MKWIAVLATIAAAFAGALTVARAAPAAETGDAPAVYFGLHRHGVLLLQPGPSSFDPSTLASDDIGPISHGVDAELFLAPLAVHAFPDNLNGLKVGDGLAVVDSTGRRCETTVSDWVLALPYSGDPSELMVDGRDMPAAGSMLVYARTSGCTGVLAAPSAIWAMPIADAPEALATEVGAAEHPRLPEIIELAVERLEDIGWRAGRMGDGGFADGMEADVEVSMVLRALPESRYLASVTIAANWDGCETVSEHAEVLLTPVEGGHTARVLHAFAAEALGTLVGAADLDGDGRLELVYSAAGSMTLLRPDGNGYRRAEHSLVFSWFDWGCCC